MSGLEILFVIISAIIIPLFILMIIIILSETLTDTEKPWCIFSTFTLFLYIIMFVGGYVYPCNVTKVETPIISYEVDDKIYQITYHPKIPTEIHTLSQYTKNEIYYWTIYQHPIFRYYFVRGENNVIFSR